MRTVAASKNDTVNASFVRLPQRHSQLQCPVHQIAFHAIADNPTDHSPGIQIEGDGQVEPFILSSKTRVFSTTISLSRRAVTHLFNVESSTPKSYATYLRGSPLVNAIRTALVRSSSIRSIAKVILLCGKKILSQERHQTATRSDPTDFLNWFMIF